MTLIAQFITKPVPRDDLPVTVAVLEDLHEQLSKAIIDLSDIACFFAPGTPSTNDILAFDGTEFVPTNAPTLETIYLTGDVPGSATAPGTAGQIAYDSDYFYVCVATDTWKRAALSTW